MLNITQTNRGEVLEVLVNTTRAAQGVSFRVYGVPFKEVKAAANALSGTARERALALREHFRAAGVKVKG